MFSLGELIEKEKSESDNTSQQIVFSNSFAELKKDKLHIFNDTNTIIMPIAIINKVLILKKRLYRYNVVSICISLIIILITFIFQLELSLMIIILAIASVFIAFGLLVNNKYYQFIIVSSEGVKTMNLHKGLKDDAKITCRKINKILEVKDTKI